MTPIWSSTEWTCQPGDQRRSQVIKCAQLSTQGPQCPLRCLQQKTKITDGLQGGLLYAQRLLLLDLQQYGIWARTAWTEHSLHMCATSLTAHQQHGGCGHAKFQSPGILDRHSGQSGQATWQEIGLECTPVQQNSRSCTA